MEFVDLNAAREFSPELHRLRELHEVVLGERGLRAHVQDRAGGVQARLDHRALLSQLRRWIPAPVTKS
ncbi:MAG TPA: hypothetical protein VIF11_07720 [Methylomirabilota bacterium]